MRTVCNQLDVSPLVYSLAAEAVMLRWTASQAISSRSASSFALCLVHGQVHHERFSSRMIHTLCTRQTQIWPHVALTRPAGP